MINKIFFISDFFAEQISGGGEINDLALMSLLKSGNREISTLNSHKVTPDIISSKHSDGYKFIVSNFVNLNKECKEILTSICDYVIIEHDHKYLLSRNPAEFENYQAPKEAIINYDFYRSAKSVFCQLAFHMDIVNKNLHIDNLINLSGNLWPLEHFKILETMSKVEKSDSYAIVNYSTAHKNTAGAIKYCLDNNIEYNLIDPSSPEEFLRKLGENKGLVFFPQTPETMSRIVVEARMMDMRVLTTKNVGALGEKWFSKKGIDLIQYMCHTKRVKIPESIIGGLRG